MKKKHMNKNVIAFRYGLVIANPIGVDNRQLTTQVQADLMHYGYILTQEAFDALAASADKDIMKWTNDVMSWIHDQYDKDQYETLYKGFPDTVKEKEIEELFFESILHYWSGGILQFDEKVKEEYHFEHVNYKEVKLGTEEDFKNIFKRLAQVNTALAPQDFEIIEWFVKEYKSFNMPEEIPFKENLCMIAALGTEVPVKTATDVLRIASYMSHGHSDLILPPKMIKEYAWSKLTPNPERSKYKFKLTENQKEYIVKALESLAGDSGKKIPFFASEMKERHKMWNKLAHHIHPTRFIDRYPRAVAALRAMDSSKPEFKQIRTYQSLVENAKTLEEKVRLLMKRPGIMARALNALILHYPDKINTILAGFIEAADKISNKVLFELWTYFEGRTKENNERKVKPKGARRPVRLPVLPVLDVDTVAIIHDAIWKALRKKIEQKEALGKVWIDEELKKIPLPTDMRTLSEQTHVVIRGQRNPIETEKRYLSLYCAWQGNTDLDFTVSIINKDGSFEKVGYGGTGFKTKDGAILHSGDNTGNYEFNSEVVSIDLENTNAKYLLAIVNVFRGTLNGNNTRIGIEERDKVFTSKTYRPETTLINMNFNSQSRYVSLFAIDVETKEWILIDEDGANVRVSNVDAIKEYLTQIAEPPKVSVYDILSLHAEARGQTVNEVEEADVVFTFEEFSKDYVKTIEYMLD